MKTIIPQFISRKIPGGITENEVQEFLNLVDSNNKFKVQKILKIA